MDFAELPPLHRDMACDPAADVLAWIEVFLAEVAASDSQRDLLGIALAGLARTVREIRAEGAWAPFIDYPFAVCRAIGRPQPNRVTPLAAACSLVFLGLDILDDVADGDRQPHWGGRAMAEISLAGATVLATLPQLILARLDVPAAIGVGMQRTLSEGLLRMSAGQQIDLALTGAADPSPAQIEAAVIGKSGEQQATYCALAAQLAGAPPELVADYAEIGRCLGTAGQLASDCHELLCDPALRDLAHGTRTLPVAIYLRRLPDCERAGFLALLGRARTNAAARREARERIAGTAAVRRVLFTAELYRQRAGRAAARACPDALRRAPLEALIDGFAALAPRETGGLMGDPLPQGEEVEA